MRSVVRVWLAGSVIGAALIAMPDDDRRVVSLSRTHGPAAVDLLGTIVLVAVWLPVVAVLWSARRRLRGPYAIGALVLAVAGLAVLSVSIAGDTGREWLMAIPLLVGAQLIALRAATRPRRR